MMKKLLASVLLATAATAASAAPVVVAGKTYDLTGRIGVKASGRCYGRSVSVGKMSPVDIFATISIGGSDTTDGTFTWSNDSLMVFGAVSNGNITLREGNRLDLAFDIGSEAPGSALFQMANIPDTSSPDGTVSFDNYVFKANVAKARKDGQPTTKIKVTEQVSTQLVMNGGQCTYRWTVKRVMKGFEATPNR